MKIYKIFFKIKDGINTDTEYKPNTCITETIIANNFIEATNIIKEKYKNSFGFYPCSMPT